MSSFYASSGSYQPPRHMTQPTFHHACAAPCIISEMTMAVRTTPTLISPLGLPFCVAFVFMFVCPFRSINVQKYCFYVGSGFYRSLVLPLLLSTRERAESSQSSCKNFRLLRIMNRLAFDWHRRADNSVNRKNVMWVKGKGLPSNGPFSFGPHLLAPAFAGAGSPCESRGRAKRKLV